MLPSPTPNPVKSAGATNVSFLQYRVALMGAVETGISTAFLVSSIVVGAIFGTAYLDCIESIALHSGAVLCFLAAWLICRRAPLSAATVKTVDAVTFLGACICYAGMGLYTPLLLRPDMMTLLILGSLVVMRSIIVPTSAKRTLIITLLAGIPVLALTIAKLTLPEAGTYQTTLLAYAPLPVNIWGTCVWWGTFTFLSTFTSHVLYGLRKQLNAAQQLGQYTLESKLGEGGMGVVYRARHAMLQRPTAIKVLRPDQTSERALERFEREVQRTAELTHPNIVTVYDYGHTPDGLFYYAMEYLDGANLEDIVAIDGPQPPARVVHWMIAVADALSEAHDIGLIHRDIKPANILVTSRGRAPDTAKLVDFGLVKDLNPDQETGLTQAESLMGTPLYMAPEVIEHANTADARSDLYALGAVMYFLLTGTPVFQSDSVMMVYSMHLTQPPEAPSIRLGSSIPSDLETLMMVYSMHLTQPPEAPSIRLGSSIPSDLETLIMMCLAKDPAARPTSSDALREALRGCDINVWRRDDAAQWWDAHGEEARHIHEDKTRSATGETLAIDMDRRPSPIQRWMRKANA